ncbi:putative zinc finger (CCCH type) protein [Neospora caninum Liverpool]|uniref:Putative zinc finger (CCCH type) protein n=1 Tax=Neospora caninum (strain Liverpool) TaxID=572307 RepID=F0VQ98_NEOCL|nr:putative zinc finger (CCCH type) protein [Neospora caninum Liverpool]CBZ55895.1 putative zinc finger (CCCH type) protein [Neospora caninum Liverpool]CEL70638.1 TPA: zinc finger (CCCH type) protein, putative [Neospora caninum Liverpool]|eukprot:XP_003885921.1 putative zinc finger (CCCH type) protein [Neospora caninum Liverpool]
MESSSTRRDTVPGTDVHDHRFKIYKIQFCRFALAGRCRRGSSCTFAHSLEDLRVRPLMKKTKICAAWRKKACPFDDESCKFAHGAGDLQKGKPALCELFRAGKCHKGAQCRFAHHVDEISTDFAPHTADALQRALPKNLTDPPLLKRLLFPRTPNSRSPVSAEDGLCARLGREPESGRGLLGASEDREKRGDERGKGVCGASLSLEAERLRDRSLLSSGLGPGAGHGRNRLPLVCDSEGKELRDRTTETQSGDPDPRLAPSPCSFRSSRSCSFGFSSPASKRRAKLARGARGTRGARAASFENTGPGAGILACSSAPSLPLLMEMSPSPVSLLANPYAPTCDKGDDREAESRGEDQDPFPFPGPLSAPQVADPCEKRGALLDNPAPLHTHPSPPFASVSCPLPRRDPRKSEGEKGLSALRPDEASASAGLKAHSPKGRSASSEAAGETQGTRPSSASPPSISAPGFFLSRSSKGAPPAYDGTTWPLPPQAVWTPAQDRPLPPAASFPACPPPAPPHVFAQVGSDCAPPLSATHRPGPPAPPHSTGQAARASLGDADMDSAFSPLSASSKKAQSSPRKKRAEGLGCGRDPSGHGDLSASSRAPLPPPSAASPLAAFPSFPSSLPPSAAVSLPSRRPGRGLVPDASSRAAEGAVYGHPVLSSVAFQAPGASPKGTACTHPQPAFVHPQPRSPGSKKEKEERKISHASSPADPDAPLYGGKNVTGNSPPQPRGPLEGVPSPSRTSFSPCSPASPMICFGSGTTRILPPTSPAPYSGASGAVRLDGAASEGTGDLSGEPARLPGGAVCFGNLGPDVSAGKESSRLAPPPVQIPLLPSWSPLVSHRPLSSPSPSCSSSSPSFASCSPSLSALTSFSRLSTASQACLSAGSSASRSCHAASPPACSPSASLPPGCASPLSPPSAAYALPLLPVGGRRVSKAEEMRGREVEPRGGPLSRREEAVPGECVREAGVGFEAEKCAPGWGVPEKSGRDKHAALRHSRSRAHTDSPGKGDVNAPLRLKNEDPTNPQVDGDGEAACSGVVPGPCPPWKSLSPCNAFLMSSGAPPVSLLCLSTAPSPPPLSPPFLNSGEADEAALLSPSTLPPYPPQILAGALSLGVSPGHPYPFAYPSSPAYPSAPPACAPFSLPSLLSSYLPPSHPQSFSLCQNEPNFSSLTSSLSSASLSSLPPHFFFPPSTGPPFYGCPALAGQPYPTQAPPAFLHSLPKEAASAPPAPPEFPPEPLSSPFLNEFPPDGCAHAEDAFAGGARGPASSSPRPGASLGETDASPAGEGEREPSASASSLAPPLHRSSLRLPSLLVSQGPAEGGAEDCHPGSARKTDFWGPESKDACNAGRSSGVHTPQLSMDRREGERDRSHPPTGMRLPAKALPRKRASWCTAEPERCLLSQTEREGRDKERNCAPAASARTGDGNASFDQAGQADARSLRGDTADFHRAQVLGEEETSRVSGQLEKLPNGIHLATAREEQSARDEANCFRFEDRPTRQGDFHGDEKVCSPVPQPDLSYLDMISVLRLQQPHMPQILQCFAPVQYED